MKMSENAVFLCGIMRFFLSGGQIIIQGGIPLRRYRLNTNEV